MRKINYVAVGLLATTVTLATAQVTNGTTTTTVPTTNGTTTNGMTTTTTTTTVPPMVMPPHLDNKVYDSMVGVWRGTSDMMGRKAQDELKIGWGLNHQFLIMSLQSRMMNKPDKYEGMGIFGIDAQGSAKTWWFDSWGADSVATGSGTFGENMLTLTTNNPKMNETRTFEIKNNHEMIMHAKGTMTWNGQSHAYDTTTVYRKVR